MTDRPPRDRPPHGSLAEEAAKLAEVAQEWFGERSRAAAGDVWANATADRSGAAATCTGCPLCRARRLLGGISPEVLGHLSAAASAFGAAVRAAGSTGSAGSSGSGAGSAGRAAGGAAAGAGGDVTDTATGSAGTAAEGAPDA